MILGLIAETASDQHLKNGRGITGYHFKCVIRKIGFSKSHSITILAMGNEFGSAIL